MEDYTVGEAAYILRVGGHRIRQMLREEEFEGRRDDISGRWPASKWAMHALKEESNVREHAKGPREAPESPVAAREWSQTMRFGSAFTKRFEDVFTDLGAGSLIPPSVIERQIIQRMRELRAKSLEERNKEAYRIGSIADQLLWYSRKARWNKKRSQRWNVSVMFLEILGLWSGQSRQPTACSLKGSSVTLGR
jgi:hypothetical protein